MSASKRVRRALAALTLGLAALPAGAAEVEEWPIEVARSGRFEVELDAAALEAMSAAGGVEVLDPGGAPVAAERFAPGRTERCRPLEVAELERRGDRWRVRLRVPEGAGEHASLRFELEDAVLASDCLLESSRDGRRWVELARADLFRIGEEASLARTRFEYAPTSARELALEWPAAAGFPRVRAAEICAPRDPAEGVALGAGGADASPLDATSARYRWPAPAAPVHLSALRLSLDAPAPAGLAYRLRAARSGRWIEVARGRWPRGRQELRLDPDGALDGVAEIALDLYGSAPAHLEAVWEVERQSVRFEAGPAGVYTLRVPAPVRRRRVEPAQAGPLPLGKSQRDVRRLRAPALGSAVAAGEFARRWAVVAEAAPGDPVALTIPPAVRAVARADLSDLRLGSAGRLVPFRKESVEGPVRLDLRTAVAPERGDDGRSRWQLDLPAADGVGEPVQLLLRAPRAAAPFERRSTLSVVPPATGRRTVRPRFAAAETWRCGGDEPVPCELALPVSAPAGSTLRIEIEDGDSAPLPKLDLELVGRPVRLLFQWPADGVDLLAGAPTLRAARFDLAALEAALELAAPAEARLGGATERATPWLERWSRPLLVAAIVLVGLVLLLMLRRLLPPARPAG